MSTEYLEKIASNERNIYTAQIVPEDFDFHSHSVIQLTYIIGGTTYLIAEGKSFLIPARHFVWIPANIEHKFIHGRRRALSVYNIYAPSFKQNKDNFHNKLGIYPAPNILIEVLKTTTNKIIYPKHEEFIFLNSFFRLLPNLIDHSFEISLPISTSKTLSEILNYILNNLGENLTLESISKRFNMSKRTLSRIFQDKLQLSFLKYIKLARTIKAIELLLESTLNITEIAYTVGYKSISAFSNAFTEMTNKRPTDFANKQ